MTSVRAEERSLASADLIAELARHARVEGANVGRWPGLTVYRFSAPAAPRWEEITSLSIGIVAQGAKVVMADGQRYTYDQLNFLVIGSRLQFQCQILQASPARPCLCLVLQVDPRVIRRLATDTFGEDSPGGADIGGAPCVVSGLDEHLMDAVLRFVRSLGTESDRRFLAPLYEQELVYRVLQGDQCARMVHIAAQQAVAPLAEALDYIAAHLAEPLTVTGLAREVNLSPSAFSRLFRDMTGQSPYQFVKAARLNRARGLLVEGLGVADVSRQVGYVSVSHFIKEFRTRFGLTPGDYGGPSPSVSRR